MSSSNPTKSVMISRHVSFPSIPTDSTLTFQVFLFFYGLLSMGLQYVNIYRTVWWLPQSYAAYGLNVDMIDFYLLIILVLIMLIKLFSVVFSQIWSTVPSSTLMLVFCRSAEIGLGLACGFSISYIAYHIINTYSVTDSLFLCYPIIVYICLFWGKIKRSFMKDVKRKKHRPMVDISLKLGDCSCSVTPDLIRNDIEMLKVDFNQRIKEILFHSLMTTYYMTVIPILYAQTSLHYDSWWVAQHVVVVWLTSFIFCLLHFLPPAYIDNLHQHAIILGKWQRVEGRNAHVPYNAWSELQIWPQGALVKHVKGLFKGIGVNNTAEPGNGMHYRFNFLFSNPLRICNWEAVLSSVLVGYQVFVLVQSTEWNHIMNISLLLFCNYFLLFRLMRDRFVLYRHYADSRILKLS